MDREELLKMLDLDGKEPSIPSEGDLTDLPEKKDSAPASNPTALDLDEWTLRKGRELRDEHERFRELDLDEHAVADFFGAAFLPEPTLLTGCVDKLRHEFIEQLLQTPEYLSLHTTTLIREAPSVLAATAFAEQYSELRKRTPDNKKEEQEASEKEERNPATTIEKAFRKEEDLDRDMATLRAVNQAVLKATDDVREVNEAAAAMGMGPGSPGSNNPKAIAALYRRVRNHPTLRKICTLAGRYRRVAQSRQRRKVIHGQDDMVGVTLDGELGRLLPHELAKLSIPEFEDDMYRRLIERQCMSREYRALEPVGKGPIIVSVDESGSMHGNKVETAKALALALAWIARQQQRWCGLVAYSGDTGERFLALSPGRWDEVKVMDWLCEFIGGGSDLDVPVREMPRIYDSLQAPRGKTDLIFVTDAICRIPHDVQTRFREWKNLVQARLITLVVQSSPGDLGPLSDEVHQVHTLEIGESAVERVLSI
jgi:uncharacterized protein with von Willebrand factor type A (vWA) domain